MSNRDPLYGDSAHTDPLQASAGKPSDPAGQVDAKANEAKAKGQKAADEVIQKGQQAKQKAGEAAGKAEAKADQGMDKAAFGLDQAADKLREKGEQQGGTVAMTTAKVADTLDSASGYLREKDTDQIVNDLEALIRRKPTESLLVAAGVGFVLSKVIR